MSLQGSALNIIDEHSRIKARNRYYWIAGLDGSDSMIFGRTDNCKCFAKLQNSAASSSDSFGCGWIQRDDDAFILASGSFLWTNGPISSQASELGFIFQVLRLLPNNCSINFYSTHLYATLYEDFSGSSPERRVSADPYLSRCSVLVDSLSSNDCSFSFNSLLDFPPFRRLLIVSLCNGVLLVIDPVKYWRTFTDMREFFDIMSLSRFVLLRSSYSSIDWTLTFDLFKDTLYHRLDVASISSFHRYRLQLWFDELPLMFRLRFHYPGLYADDSLCPNCGIPFGIDSLPSLGFSSLQNYSDTLTFTGLWFLRGFIPRDLSSLIASSSGLPRRAASQIILRQFLKLHTSPVTLSLTNESLSPLQASEWSSLGIFWTHSAIIRDRLISLLLQLPGRQNLLIIGAYIPPASGLNNKLIAECHFTFVNWITSARATGVHIMLGGDLNANFDSFIKNISNDDIRSPLHSLFRFLHTHQFDDLCALDPSTSLPLPTFTSVSSGQLSRLDYLWTSPDFLATHLWSHVMDTLDTFNSDHMLLIGFFDFLSIRDMRAHSYLKQRSRYRTVYNFHTALPDQKALFTSEVDVDRVLVTDIPGSLQLLIAPDDIHAAAIKHFQNVVGSARSPFKSLNELPERWKNRYTPISEINPDIYQLVMAPIDNSELRAVINDSPSWKAPGPSSIPYEWFKLLSTDGISYLCQLMNSCLVLADIPEDWRLASIVPIPKPHEFECLLKNTCPITLLETARKLLVKIITARLSKVMATQHVLTGDNFAGLSGSSVTTPINVLDGIMKSHCISSQSQELWILSQDISKAFDSIDLSMLKLSFERLKFPLTFLILLLVCSLLGKIISLLPLDVQSHIIS
ncbi:hypothetical protein RhiirA4_474391 [Rhizophagus irregularis]|uniref:Reverse transcriptase domain-containing protein n=1 Tax=Rhizophagus irregularis TaxID=588596 RepID=A0A2I1H8C5_9GLOM|nr:hypothetical protein RhiirA4_474391 [Rhizophagus irregularis]